MDLLKAFTINDNFWKRYDQLIKNVVLPYQEKVLHDDMPDAEKSQCIENFRLAATYLETGQQNKAYYGMVFQDSDVAKWLEAASYSLLSTPDKALEQRCDDVIDLIGRAQHADGYLNTYFTLKEPDKRWTHLHEGHELYCTGHMIEAAVAYAKATGKHQLLDIMCAMVDHIYDHFMTKGAMGYPGHPEIEMALMTLYRYTNNKKHLELARHFVDVRGVDSDYYIKERQQYDWLIFGGNPTDKEYAQNHLPVREQSEATGHAVRAVYLYAGMADVAFFSQDARLTEACKRLFGSIIQRKMYVTGGIGAVHEGEAFSCDYHLPNDTAYAETCAAIGLVFFARRMLELEKKSYYADIMERALYNGILAGISLDGTRFFYVNPLEVIPGISGCAKSHPHTRPTRSRWFACACCPPNLARLVLSIANYAWCINDDTIYANLFIGGTLDLNTAFGGKILVETNYPYDNTVVYRFLTDTTSMQLCLAVRLPMWSMKTDILINGRKEDVSIKDGYAMIKRSFLDGDTISVTFDMSVRRVYANTNVRANSGCVAMTRGPLVYCAEALDNDQDILALRVKKDSNPDIKPYNKDLLSGVVEIIVDGYRVIGKDTLYTYEQPDPMPCKISLIPYYAWGNRGMNQMSIWLVEK